MPNSELSIIAPPGRQIHAIAARFLVDIKRFLNGPPSIHDKS
jgi:hypothetical protein